MDSTAQFSIDARSLGFFLGVISGEGHFGGDGKQPQVTLRMHTKHEKLFRWIELTFPGGRLYGPYHSSGRSWYQWMARGAYLRQHLVPLIERNVDLLDDHVAGRFHRMCADYGIETGIAPAGPAGFREKLDKAHESG